MNILLLDSKPDPGRIKRLEARLQSLGMGLFTVQSEEELLQRLAARGYAIVILDLDCSTIPVAELAAAVRRFRPKSRILAQGSADQWALLGPALQSLGVRRHLARPWTVGSLLNLMADELDDDEPSMNTLEELGALGDDIAEFQKQAEDPDRIVQKVRLEPKRSQVEATGSKPVQNTVAPQEGVGAPAPKQSPDYPQKRGEKDPYVRVEVTRDGVTARLICYPYEDRYHSMDDLREILGKQKIVHGVDFDRLDHLIKHVNQSGEPVLGEIIAQGQPSVDGKNGRIEWYVATSVRVNLEEDSDGKVDYKDLFEIPCVRAEEKMAQIYPPTEPVDGLSVYGKPLIGKRGKSVKAAPGKGCRLNADDNCFYADIDGQVQAKGGKVSVVPVWNVKEDVDLRTGNIEFLGSVIVQGNVMAGFSIKAEGDILIKGLVEAAELKAGGAITVKMGVVANGKGNIETGESLYAKYLSAATVSAEGDVNIEDTIMNSRVAAGGKVTVSKNKGSIVGGEVAAVNGIDCLNAGSDMDQTTGMIIGEQYFVRERIKKLNAQIQRSTSQFESLKSALQPWDAYKDGDPRISQEQRKSLQQIRQTYTEVRNKLSELEKRKEDAAQGLNRLCYARLNVRNVAHSNLRLQIGVSQMSTSKAHTFCSFYEERQSTEVRLGSYEGKIEGKKKTITTK